eukprot:4623265-Alexandrium_andersonii.AAC.1
MGGGQAGAAPLPAPATAVGSSPGCRRPRPTDRAPAQSAVAVDPSSAARHATGRQLHDEGG